MGLISIDFRCSSCSTRYVSTVERSEASWDTVMDCVACLDKSTVKRTPSSPNVVGKASYLDGQRKDTHDLKIAARLDVERANLRPEDPDRIRISKEIHALKKL